MSNRMIWVLCFAVLLPVMGCYTPRKGRDCRLFDTRTSYLDTKFSLTAESSSDAQTHQLLSDFGCIAIKTHVTAYDRIDCVRIYEIADWSKSEVGMEERDAFLISDPPQVDYPGVTNRERPSSIPASVRKPSGVQRSDLPASRFPVRVQWQVVISDYDEWIEVGQCLHSIGDHMLSDWDGWSRQSPKYDANGCAYHWRSFKADGKRDVRHLCNLAKDDGWQPKQRQLPPVATTAKPKPKRTDQQKQCRDDGGQGLGQSVGPFALENENGNE